MGEVLSYTKEALDLFLADASVVGSTLILTRKNGETVELDLAAVSTIDQSDIDAAVNALVNGAPGALNTLNEIAAALGNDANLATTLTNSIAAEATARANAVTAEATARTNADTAVKLGAMGVVIHGATAGTARPAGYGAIHWVGSVTPTNAIDNDVWTDTSA